MFAVLSSLLPKKCASKHRYWTQLWQSSLHICMAVSTKLTSKVGFVNTIINHIKYNYTMQTTYVHQK